MKSSMKIETCQLGLPTNIFPWSAPPTDLLNTSYVLRFMWCHIWLRDQHTFIQVHMKALGGISLHTADPTWITRVCVYDGEVDLFTCASAYMKRSVWPSVSHVSVKGPPKNSLSTLEQSLADGVPECTFSVMPNKSLFWTILILL